MNNNHKRPTRTHILLHFLAFPTCSDSSLAPVGLLPGLFFLTPLALTVARAQSGKKTVLVQPQGYHGAGPVWTKGRPGVLENDTAHQINYEYNNLESIKSAISK